ncbi:hypothetical protein H4R18_003686 [Coemansia javaensis]|uniref:DUF3074 domain-containing protein n=1 Tax=Coemansia javaensis TaxID=2761396 RepID=A0A9W8LFY5_9FUNG|nr:hypothetical protein H4R18_003686 [Coemansia javaensis]
MVLRPIRRAAVPSALEEPHKFDDFVTQYLNKCDDLLSYTQRYPTTQHAGMVRMQRQNRSPHESHRWLRRTVRVPRELASYDELRQALFVDRAEHAARWTPQMTACERVESIVPNLCEVLWLAFRSLGLAAKRDYCQMVVRREFVGHAARPKPRLFTPSASVTNLAHVFRSQSTASLNNPAHLQCASLPPSPPSPGLPLTDGYFGLAHARSVVDLHDAVAASTRDPSPYGHTRSRSNLAVPQNQYAGLCPQESIYYNDPAVAADVPVRRFQIVVVPIVHRDCPERRGFVRAVYESYEEVREYADGRVEWICIYHSDFSGWVPAFVADRFVASAFPKEAHALLDYVQSWRKR